MSSESLEWADVSGTSFGAAQPNGSCNAICPGGHVCGWPRRTDGTCLNGHPAQPRERA